MSVDVYGLIQLQLKLLHYGLQNVPESVPLFSLRELSLNNIYLIDHDMPLFFPRESSLNNVYLIDHVRRAVLGAVSLINCLLKLCVCEVIL